MVCFRVKFTFIIIIIIIITSICRARNLWIRERHFITSDFNLTSSLEHKRYVSLSTNGHRLYHNVTLKAKPFDKGLSYINAIFSVVWNDLFLSGGNLIDISIDFYFRTDAEINYHQTRLTANDLRPTGYAVYYRAQTAMGVYAIHLLCSCVLRYCLAKQARQYVKKATSLFLTCSLLLSVRHIFIVHLPQT
jgi:hypothetical protein